MQWDSNMGLFPTDQLSSSALQQQLISRRK